MGAKDKFSLSRTSETREKGGSMGIEENITDRLFLVKICFSFFPLLKVERNLTSVNGIHSESLEK